MGEAKELFLFYISVFLIALSLLTIGFEINANATSGFINVSIESYVRINFTSDFIDFGPGSISQGAQNATLDTFGTVTNGNWTPVNNGFILENTGNVNVSIDLKSTKNASSFVGGTSPMYQYSINNSEQGSCDSPIVMGEWYEVNTTSPGTRICSLMQYSQEHDSISIDLKMVVPSDSLSGVRTDTFTATATAI
ncbi:MAG: hypothetical protein ACP5OG_02425 [Candidatus Nanoarchaeia archaeon]